jgi:hypothetical protein
MFGIATAISGIWAAYSKSLIERLSEIYTERGRLHADDLVTWIDSSVHSLNQFLRKWIVWQFSGFEAKYLKLQAEIVEEYTTEGFSQSQHATLMLEDVFVELGLKGLSNENNLNVWDLIRRSRKDKQFRQMMIIREGGFGKTTLLKHITWVYSKGKYKKYKVHRLIPFLIFLSDWKKDEMILSYSSLPSLPDLISEYHLSQISKYHHSFSNISKRWISKLLDSGNALVMFDGFDELTKAQRHRFSDWIGRQMQKHNNTVFIITSRPSILIDYIAERDPTLPLTIKDFSQQQQTYFVKQWYLSQESIFSTKKDIKQRVEKKSQNLLNQLKDPRRPELQELAKNPLTLHLLTIFHCSNPEVELPSRRTDLYKNICDLLLEDRHRERGIELLLKKSECQEVVQQLALHLVKKDISKIEHKDLLLFLQELPVFKEKEDVKPEEVLRQLVEVSELLVKRQSNEYEFRHFSFQSYLAANHLVQQGDDDTVIQNWNIESWRQTILFYTSQLRPNPLTKLLREVCFGGEKFAALAFDCLHEYYKQEELDDDLERQLKLLGNDEKVLLYKDLFKHLKHGRWIEADVETYNLMLKVSKREKSGRLRIEDIKSFPCEDLQEIDQLWKKFSKNKFGFSIQKKIWLSCGGKINDYNYTVLEKFKEEVKWYRPRNDNWSSYHELINTPQNAQIPVTACLPRLVWRSNSENLICLLSREDLQIEVD